MKNKRRKIKKRSLGCLLAALIFMNSVPSLLLAEEMNETTLTEPTEEVTAEIAEQNSAVPAVAPVDTQALPAELQSGPAAGQVQVAYKYEAKDAMGRAITDIPEEVLNTLPAAENVNEGTTVNPTDPTQKLFPKSTYQDRKGKWKFVNWDKESLTVSGDETQDVFIGTWIFTDLGFCKSPYLGNQYIGVDQHSRYKVGKFYIELEIDRLKGVNPPANEPFTTPKTYEITALLSDDKGDTRRGDDSTPGKVVATGTYMKDPDWSKWKTNRKPFTDHATEGGYLVDSYGKPVKLPMFDENGVGIQYSIQNLDPPFPNEVNPSTGEKGYDHHPRWLSSNATPSSNFNLPDPVTGEILANTYFFNGYQELVSSDFRSTWLTSLSEADRPDIRAIVPPSGPDEFTVYIPLLKKNYEDSPENFVRARTDGLNDTWLHNYTYDEDKEQFGLLDYYKDPDTGEEISDLRRKLPVALEGIDNEGFIEKDGHRFKSSITYDIYDGAFATFQEEYKVKFHTEGGKFSDGTTQDKTFAVLHGDALKTAEAQAIAKPTRPNYRFAGWRVGQEDPIQSFTGTAPVTQNMDLYAMWEKKPPVLTKDPKQDPDYRKVTFDPNEGAFGNSTEPVSYWVLKDLTLKAALQVADEQGHTIMTVPTASREEYDWLGWASAKDKKDAQYKADISDFTEPAGSTADLTFYAIYKEQVKSKVNYVFKAQDAAGKDLATLPAELQDLLPTDAKAYLLGTKVQPKAPAETKVDGTHAGRKGNWNFQGWSPEEITVAETGNTFTGTWKFTINQYKLTFHAEDGAFYDGEKTKTFDVLDGDKLKAAEVKRVEKPTRQYYNFKGWQIGTGHQAELFNFETPVTQNMEMYAVWEKKPMLLTKEPKQDPDYRKVTFDANGGGLDTGKTTLSYWILKDVSFEQVAAKLDQAGQPIMPIPTAKKQGYDWLGWADEKMKKAADYEIDMSDFRDAPDSTGDLTFYAVYKAKIYRLYFDYDGGKDSAGRTDFTLKAKMDEQVTIIPAPVREGYKFLYWKGSLYNPGDEYLVKGNHDFIAVWEKLPETTCSTSGPGAGSQSSQTEKPGATNRVSPTDAGGGATQQKAGAVSKTGLPRTGEHSFVAQALLLILAALTLVFMKKRRA